MDNKPVQESGRKNLIHHLRQAEKRGLAAQERICVVMFIDIVGYSVFVSRSTDSQALELVRRFENAARSMISEFDGRVVMTAGDAVLACWRGHENLGRAGRCARLIKQRLDEENRRYPRSEKIRIRVGIHAGKVLELQDGDIIGNAVNLASRLQTAAKPGEVLISAEASETGAVCREMPASHKIGHMRLKGFDQAIEVCCLSDTPKDRPSKFPKKQCLKPITDSFASPFRLQNWSWGAWAFIVTGLLLGLGMAMTSASAEFPNPHRTAAAIFLLFYGWAFFWASYRPRTVSLLHPFFRAAGLLVWGLIIIFAGGYFGCWPG